MTPAHEQGVVSLDSRHFDRVGVWFVCWGCVQRVPFSFLTLFLASLVLRDNPFAWLFRKPANLLWRPRFEQMHRLGHVSSLGRTAA